MGRNLGNGVDIPRRFFSWVRAFLTGAARHRHRITLSGMPFTPKRIDCREDKAVVRLKALPHLISIRCRPVLGQRRQHCRVEYHRKTKNQRGQDGASPGKEPVALRIIDGSIPLVSRHAEDNNETQDDRY